MRARRTTATCADCQRGPREIYGRGLCNSCYRRHLRNQTLHLFQSTRRLRTDLVEDWRLLVASGCTHAEIARRLGMLPQSLSQALRRARRSGLLESS